MNSTQPCITCKFFFEYRTPEDRAKYGEGKGRCELKELKYRELKRIVGKADFTWPIVVNRDSTCGEHEALT